MSEEMPREIKFRAWDEEEKRINSWEMLMNCNNSWLIDLIDGQLLDDYKLMQFTGLKDKNGKEIYEGDILSQGEGEHETLIEVRFGNGTFDSGCYNFTGFYGIYLKIGFGGGFNPGDLCENMDEVTQEECLRRKVIGNIYENLELLEGGTKDD